MAKRTVLRNYDEVVARENWGCLSETVFNIVGNWYVADYNAKSTDDDDEKTDANDEKKAAVKSLEDWGKISAEVELYGFYDDVRIDYFDGIGNSLCGYTGRQGGIKAVQILLNHAGLKSFGDFSEVLYDWMYASAKGVKADNSAVKSTKKGIEKKAALKRGVETVAQGKRLAIKFFMAFLYDGINHAFPTALQGGDYDFSVIARKIEKAD